MADEQPDLTMPHAYLIHGTSTKDDDWFPLA